MNRRKFLKAAIAGIPLILSCSKNPVKSEKISGVNFYLLKDENLTFKDVEELPLSQLNLNENPWISSDDIKHYDWIAHIIFLEEDMPLSYEGISTYGKPFVVTVNEEKCYSGYLLPSFSSWRSFNYPHISLPQQSDSAIYITYTGEKANDPRTDSRIKEVLIAQGQLFPLE